MAQSRGSLDAQIITPSLRGILPLSALHIPKRLRRTIRQNPVEVRIDFDFAATVAACAAPADDREETWISYGIEYYYTQLHEHGHAHSVECWHEGALVGGLYGVSLGAAFFGESMFSRARDVSKIALIHLCARLIYGGYELLDTQFLTAHLAQFGALEITQESYMDRLEVALEKSADFYKMPTQTDGRRALEIIDAAQTR